LVNQITLVKTSAAASPAGFEDAKPLEAPAATEDAVVPTSESENEVSRILALSNKLDHEIRMVQDASVSIPATEQEVVAVPEFETGALTVGESEPAREDVVAPEEEPQEAIDTPLKEDEVIGTSVKEDETDVAAASTERATELAPAQKVEDSCDGTSQEEQVDILPAAESAPGEVECAAIPEGAQEVLVTPEALAAPAATEPVVEAPAADPVQVAELFTGSADASTQEDDAVEEAVTEGNHVEPAAAENAITVPVPEEAPAPDEEGDSPAAAEILPEAEPTGIDISTNEVETPDVPVTELTEAEPPLTAAVESDTTSMNQTQVITEEVTAELTEDTPVEDANDMPDEAEKEARNAFLYADMFNETLHKGQEYL
jgi:hypothetical protein